MSDILVISAHPDDETLGCGGTLLKHRAGGDRLHWLVATCAYEPTWSRATIIKKTREVDAVAAAYGMKEVHRLGLPTAKLDTVPRGKLIGAIRKVVDDVRPELVYIVHGGDVHDDHRILFNAAMSAMKPSRMKDIGLRRILSYETLSSTEAAPALRKSVFLPVIFSDISETMKRKLEIMRLYRTELQRGAMPRGLSAVRALARYRGATVGVEYAEAFMLIRELA